MHYMVKGDVDERAVEQLVRCADEGDVVGAALCADGHVGYSQPIGGVVAYRDCISPSGVGYDIGCGSSDLTDLPENSLDLGSPLSGQAQKPWEIRRVMDEIVARISFGMGRNNDEPVDHPVLEKIADAPFEPQRKLVQSAANQLGTVGAGNHYVDLFSDEDGWVWVGVHFGSRGFGHKTASGFLALAQGKAFDEHAKDGEMDSPPILFHVDSELGQSYIEAMTLAGEYAYAGRDVVVDKVLEILGAKAEYEVHNHHNFAWREKHGTRTCDNCAGHGTAFASLTPNGEALMVAAGGACRECGGSGRVGGEDAWVVRKGCTPAWPGQAGFVGATMGEPSVILEGVDSEDSASLLYSTVHGAGRVMSRTQAAGKTRRFNVWECNDRDCSYRAPKDKQLPGGERIPCPDHPDGRLLKRVVTEQIRPGLIDYAKVRADLDQRIEIRGGAADEAPAAYKRLDQVLAAHEGTIRILHTLTPIGVAMAGPDVIDPFKD